MKASERWTTLQRLAVPLGVLLAAPLSGCVAVGYSSRGGFFVWPGGVGLLLIVLLVLFLLRGRR